MRELIDKKSLLIALVNWQMEQFSEVGHEREFNLLKMIIHGVENEPVVKAIPVVYGEWIAQNEGLTKFKCSRCESENHAGHEKFCPECGANMKKTDRHN